MEKYDPSIMMFCFFFSISYHSKKDFLIVKSV